jgi:hypothetical protein
VVLLWVKEQIILRIFCNEKIKNEKAFLGKLFKGKGVSSSGGGSNTSDAFGMFNFADLFRRVGARVVIMLLVEILLHGVKKRWLV